jgi:hypothetical protein
MNPPSSISCKSIKKNKMETLYQHQLRPKIYYQIGFGWKTDRLHHLRIVNKINNLKN